MHTASGVRPSDAQEVAQQNADPKPSQDNKTGYFYAPFASEDMLTLVLNTNQARRSAGKDIRTIIVQSDADKQQLDSLKHQMVEKLFQDASRPLVMGNSLIAKHDASEQEFIEAVGPAHFEDLLRASEDIAWRADTLLRTKIISNEQSQIMGTLKNDESKIYVVGHGKHGSSDILDDRHASQERKALSSKEIAQQFSQGGLSKSFTDVRVVACYSADARQPASFDTADLQSASEPEKKKTWFFGQDKVTVQSFAQSLANELKQVGFEQPEVSGYHGRTIIESKDGHRYQRLSADSQDIVRSSELRQVFLPV
ncbi:C80 family cysteine peptidase [Pseudovibrio ascidiaceicola]|uniref:C80 family cysteine peptidase n=1 Tax=Pseudovibrio ascidiaceicola TaxID=285279 RepID=UPI003D365B0D